MISAEETAGNPKNQLKGVVPPARPHDEDLRLRALRQLEVLDTAIEERFDRITRLASRVLAAPIAYVSLVDENRQWLKSQVGIELNETPRDLSFCGHAILQDGTLVIADTLKDPRFAENPLVTGEPYVRFYAGRPVRSPDLFKVGTLCIMDSKPRELGLDEQELLVELAELVERELSLTDTIALQKETLLAKEQLIENQRDLARLYSELQAEREKSEELLLNILPSAVAEELKRHGRVEAVQYPCASVMFADFVGFTQLTETFAPEALVRELHECFTEFDRIVASYGVEKLKTIGDGYMCVAGIPNRCIRHAHDMVRAAVDIRSFVSKRRAERIARGEAYWDIRIGIHSGPVVAGVVGLNKFAYDVWGATVNIAARMETASESGRINISRRTHDLIAGEYHCTFRGKIPVRNHEPVEMFFVEELRPVRLSSESE